MATDFESLMAPLCANDIAKSVRQGRPIFQSGHSAKFRGLFSRRQFDQVAKNCADLHVVYPCKNRVTMSPARPISAEEVQGHYDAGGTVCITGANRNSSRLGRLAAAFKSSLGWAGVVDCRAYLSNDGSGYTPHFDDKLVITLQIEGRKQWQVAAKASVRNPLTNAGRFPDGVYRHFKEAHTLQPWERLEQPTFPHHANTYTLSPA